MARTRWLAAGVALGAGGSWWARRKAQTLQARYRPARVVGATLGRITAWPDEVRAAMAEGRAAMRERERELRALDPPAAGRPSNHR